LVLALNPALGAFGILISLSVLYAFLSSILVLPSTIVVWARLTEPEGVRLPIIEAISGSDTAESTTAD
jgi:predicted RND superfamily exporter protein